MDLGEIGWKYANCLRIMLSDIFRFLSAEALGAVNRKLNYNVVFNMNYGKF